MRTKTDIEGGVSFLVAGDYGRRKSGRSVRSDPVAVHCVLVRRPTERSKEFIVGASRRAFLKILTCLASTGIAGTFSADGAELGEPPAEPIAAKPGDQGGAYKVVPWTGDNFKLGHELRDGKLSRFPDKADEKVDFVIVGGGMAGLTCSYFLRGHDFVLLEQYANTGGTSSGGTYKGIDYSMGAVCTGSHDGVFKELFDELSITPVTISPEETAWHGGGQWYKGVSGNNKFHKELNRLKSDIAAINKSKSASEARRTAGELDQLCFSKYLSGYDREFLGLINNTCNSFFCASPDEVAAPAGFFMVTALTTNSYVFNGGNSGIAKALRARVDKHDAKRIRPSCFVWSVQETPAGAAVIYSDEKGEMHRIECRHVVVATPPLVALRIVQDLPAAMTAVFQKLEYSAFLVANFCMRKKVLDYPYQSFADEPYPFGQLIMAEAPYMAAGKYNPDMGSVLTVYHPFGHGPTGRARLLAAQKEQLASSLIPQLSKLLEPLQNNLDEVVFTRWGHAGVVPRPGIAKTIQEIKQQTNWMTYAHSTASGSASFEGAVLSARMAADRCLKV